MSAKDGVGFAIDPGKVRAWKRYPAYKDSGVEWLGEVPAGWELIRLKQAMRMVTQRATDQNSNSNYIGLENIESWTGRLIVGEDTLDPEGQSGSFEPGDVLFGKLRPYLAKVHKATVDGMCSTEILVLRPKLVSQDYLFYYLLNSEFIKTVNSSTYGTKMPRANWGFIGNLLIPNISLQDQSTIAAFLDRETARIDALIAKKQRFIELLEEKRQAVISHAVTKGLDPDAEMRDSGVEWIGEVPAGWEISRLGLISESLQTGPFGSQLHSSDYIEDGIPVINPSNIQDGTIVPDSKCTIDDNKLKRLIRHRLTAGDIIFARRGDMGRCACITRETEGWLCGTGSIRIRLNKSAHPEFVMAYLSTQGVKGHLLIESVGSTMDNLNTSILSRIPVVLPSLEEQKAIMEKVSVRIGQIDEMLSNTSESVSKLREYRTALISAAVTGKIDVRGEAPAAP